MLENGDVISHRQLIMPEVSVVTISGVCSIWKMKRNEKNSATRTTVG